MRAAWPCEFGVIFSVTLGQKSLVTRAVVRNEGTVPWEFNWLWHTYFRVEVGYRDSPLGKATPPMVHRLANPGLLHRISTKPT
jgi:hypothetical protein